MRLPASILNAGLHIVNESFGGCHVQSISTSLGFFSATKKIEIGKDQKKTVKEVMDLAKVQLKSELVFDYKAMDEGKIVNSIMAYYPGGVTSRTKRFYPPGVYRLGQTFTMPTPNPYSVWQYYLFNEKGERHPVEAETSYAVSTVENGWKIVWRLVTICNGPTGISHRVDKMLPPDVLTPEIF